MLDFAVCVDLNVLPSITVLTQHISDKLVGSDRGGIISQVQFNTLKPEKHRSHLSELFLWSLKDVLVLLFLLPSGVLMPCNSTASVV